MAIIKNPLTILKAKTGDISINQNGQYNAEDYGYDGFKNVDVNVQGGGGQVSDVDPLYWKQTSRTTFDLLILPIAIEDVNIVASATQGEEGLEITLEV